MLTEYNNLHLAKPCGVFQVITVEVEQARRIASAYMEKQKDVMSGIGIYDI